MKIAIPANGRVVSDHFGHCVCFKVFNIQNNQIIAETIIENPGNHKPGVLPQLLKNNEIELTGTAPEGANCLLSYDEYVAPFRSKGMIAAAIKADTSICLMAHQGAEDWNIRADLPFGWSVPFTNGLKGVNIPLLPYKKINHYILLCRRYEPSISSADLKDKSKREARLLLNIEIERIRAEMNLMTDEVKALIKKKAITPRLINSQKAKPWKNNIFQLQNQMFPSDEAYV